MNEDYGHLTHIESHDDLALYELIPSVVWIFDLDRHGWWWGNQASLDFWGLETLDDLIDKDLSGDSQGARDRTKQTFDLAAKNGLTVDPWTTYPDGKPKTLYMMHRAALVGPEKHRAIIAYVNEEVSLGDTPENLLLVEAMRYTTLPVTSFTLDGDPVVENPAATEAYASIDPKALPEGVNAFTARFKDLDAGRACMDKALAEKGGRWTHVMKTDHGARTHTLDIRMTRHPLNGDWLFLVTEYDVTALHDAQDELRRMAHYDALTGLPSLNLLRESSSVLLSQAARHKRKLAVLFVDLDGFKAVNDTWGHDAGDAVFREVARRLPGCLRDSDQVARIGGDEFVVLVQDTADRDATANVARKIIESLARPIDLTCDGESVQANIGASIGIAIYPDHGEDIEALLKVADQSMYMAKKAGKGDYRLA